MSKSLHGIKSIEYSAKSIGNNVFQVECVLHDIYDFSYKSFQDIDLGYGYITTMINNLANRGEDLDVVNNFKIQIKLDLTIKIDEKN